MLIIDKKKHFDDLVFPLPVFSYIGDNDLKEAGYFQNFSGFWVLLN